MTFLAGLELAKRRLLALRQREPFSALWLYRRNGANRIEDHEDH
jgi:chromatin segregation and condensation protein Rec8/ScpA/Scc1 (kleisin family)